MQSEYFFEGADWLGIYKKSPDPSFSTLDLEIRGQEIPLFYGKIPLSFWLNIQAPLLSIPVAFWGSPVTDLFPRNGSIFSRAMANDIISGVADAAIQKRLWAIIVKDLPEGHYLEQPLAESGFISINHDPIWYMPIPHTLQTYLNGLSKGRRRGLEGRWKKFKQQVVVRSAIKEDLDFIRVSYKKVWMRSKMRLERLSADFFSNCLLHPDCRILIFERDKAPFAFVMLWQKDDIWFDKYIGTDDVIYKDVSFYSVSILYLLDIAPHYGIKWYVAGQGAGEEKAGLGFASIGVNLWVKPLLFNFIATPVIKRFMQAHNKRIYTDKGYREA